MKSRKQRIHKRKTFRNRGLNRKTRSKTQLRKRNKSRKMKGSGPFSGLNKPTKELFNRISSNTLNNDKLVELIGKGANIEATNFLGYTPLLKATADNKFEISKLLIESGADVNVKNINDNNTPLLWATYRNNTEISKLLIESGAEVNVYGEIFGKRHTPLIWAVMNNNLEICKLLINNGADVNAKVYYDNTALLYAVKNKNFDICKLLINAGADIHAQTKSGLLPPYSYSTTIQKLLQTTPFLYATSLNASKYADIINLFKTANVAENEVAENKVAENEVAENEIDLLKDETNVLNPIHVKTNIASDQTPNV